MGLLKDMLFGAPEGSNKNVKLLLKIKRFDGSDEEEVVIVKEHDVQHTCEAFAEADDVREVWAYRQFFHRLKEPAEPGMEPAEFIPVVAALKL